MVKHTQISQQQQTNCFSVIVDREVLVSPYKRRRSMLQRLMLAFLMGIGKIYG